MTVSGRVTAASGAPVQGASVTISALNINARTSADGSYNFIIRSAQVMGQTVPMTARHGRFGSQTVQFRVVGGSVTQDFVLGADRVAPADSTRRPSGGAPASGLSACPLVGLSDCHVALDASAPDLPTALAGRIAGLITNSAPQGGTSPMLYRGARSLYGNTQPLVVVDGVVIDNQGFATLAQRFGLGGFDYGTPLQDIALDDIASAELLDQATAAARYGSRAANGVIEIHTKRGDITGFALSISQRFTGQGITRLPGYQNSFGQGLGGQFEFFDGQGGGVNDDVAQSWGPRLDARAVSQHSLTEPRRPDVRFFLPQPEDVENYFAGGSTWDANVALLGSRGTSSMRAALNARTLSGTTPGASLTRVGVTLSGRARPSAQFVASANVQVIGASAKQRAGTGFDELNPFSGFTRMGRQVDLDALRDRITDASGNQINWIYTNRNNPFFATSRNSNEDERGQVIASVSAAYDIRPNVDARVSVGFNDWSETRKVGVASGWRGGYNSSLGLGNFSGGGTDDQNVGGSEQTINVSINGARSRVAGFSARGTLGAELRSNRFDMTSSIVDQPTDGESSIATLARDAEHDVTSFFALATAGRGALSLSGGARMEQSSSLPNLGSVIYPTATASYNLAPRSALVRNSLQLSDATVFARFWKAGNELTQRTLATGYFGGQPIAPELDIVSPERTVGVEVGTRLATASRHTLDFVGYRERSTELLVATAAGDGSAVIAQSGQVFNSGIEATLRSTLLPGEHSGWDVALTYARNTSTVDALRPGVFNANLSPTTFGAGLAARIGSPAGVIVGSRVLRDANGAPLLRNGLPVADANAPFAILGSVQPDWSAGIENRVRFMGAELAFLVEVRMGGEVFSATNMWGGFAGTLDQTLIGDRAPGAAAGDSLTIAGVDSASGATNAIKVSAEQYFHTLGAITEPWVYDASFIKLREARLSYSVPTRFVPGFREHTLRLSLIGRNLLTSARAPNVDPESALSAGFRGFEMGQLPQARSVGLQVTIAP
ncbi:MAG TPA: TonB-dependent receptor plug domain-containing protein [Gemmatimonadaceae bacterium]|nr:TonB-dependent receptor plug domain-containing protein [Gemmatimonadaceae bacterium]